MGNFTKQIQNHLRIQSLFSIQFWLCVLTPAHSQLEYFSPFFFNWPEINVLWNFLNTLQPTTESERHVLQEDVGVYWNLLYNLIYYPWHNIWEKNADL